MTTTSHSSPDDGTARTPLVLGIDPARTTGWALLDLATGNRVASGLVEFRQKWLPDAFASFRQWLDDLVLDYPGRVKAICVEEPNTIRSQAQARIAFGLLAIAAEYCATIDRAFLAVTASQVKAAAGSGRFGKEEMLGAARTAWGYAIATHDEADACWVAETMRRMIRDGARKSNQQRKT